MGCVNTSPEVAARVEATTNTGGTPQWVYEPTTDWMLALGVDVVKVVLKMKNSSQLTANAVYQTATTRPDDPQSWSASLGTDLTTNNEMCSGTVDIWSATRPAFYVRFGRAFKATAGQTGSADLLMQTTVQQCAQLVASKTIDVNIATSGNYDEVVSDWMPANSAAVAKANVLMTNCSTYLRCQLIYQKATASIESPGAWTTLGSAISRTGTNTEACTGEVVLGATAEMWIRFGIRSTASSGSSAKGTITVAIATKPA